jgi:hypothetical protein
MIVWRGCGPLNEHNCEIASGERYNPTTDAWRISLVDVVTRSGRMATRVASGGPCYLRNFSSRMAVFLPYGCRFKGI